MDINTRRSDQVAILDVSGDIDLANSPKMRKALLHELKELRTPRVLLNLEAVKYIDSSGVASLVEGLKASRDGGSKFVLYGLSTGVREVMQLSKLVRIFDICDTEDDALVK